ncbi:MAG: hypothetical protein OXG35_23575 [Acidobacteria bacterium]|nr:hypothetical protein [Acidobacteriota bacterium]
MDIRGTITGVDDSTHGAGAVYVRKTIQQLARGLDVRRDARSTLLATSARLLVDGVPERCSAGTWCSCGSAGCVRRRGGPTTR